MPMKLMRFDTEMFRPPRQARPAGNVVASQRRCSTGTGNLGTGHSGQPAASPGAPRMAITSVTIRRAN